MSWLRLKLSVAGHFADELSDYCLELGAVSAVLDNAGADSLLEAVLEPDPGATIVWEHALITAYWDITEDLQMISSLLSQRIHDKSIFAEITAEFLSDDDLAKIPEQPVRELCFGDNQLWLVPRSVSAERLGQLSGQAVLKLDPGLAFGSGLHPTTQLCLNYLAGWAELSGARVLDFGCGSGVLGLGALALGARFAHGVDHDPQALVATLDNAAYNDLSGGVQVFMPSELPDDAYYEVVVANILANPLIELAEEISGRLLAGGLLVLAGLLAEQTESVQAAYPDISFESPIAYQGSVIARAVQAVAGDMATASTVSPDEDWVCLVGRKSSVAREVARDKPTRQNEQAV